MIETKESLSSHCWIWILVAINRNEQMTLVIVEQNMPILIGMTDRFITLEQGRIVA